MTASRRRATLSLLLVGLGAIAALASVLWLAGGRHLAHAQALTNQDATGAPVVLASAEDPGVLAVDTSGIGDPDGIPNVGRQLATGILHDFSYRWIRVDGDTEIVVGADSTEYRQVAGQIELVAGVTATDAELMIESGRYRRVEADIGKLLKVEVSFTDSMGNSETVTSLPFGPVPAPAPPLPASTLVANTGQPESATAMITAQYAMGFQLGDHGLGYEISGVSIELAAVPSSGLTVSLWMGHAPGSGTIGARTKLFDFENPSSFAAGLNEFTAPPGAFAYQNVDYFIVLSDFGTSLSIKETTTDDQDDAFEGVFREPGATLANSAGGDTNVLRLAIKGSRRNSGILASNYAQAQDLQEIVSVGDEGGIEITVGAADRYLIRGMTLSGDNGADGGGYTNPWYLRDGTTKLFSLINTRQIDGIMEWTAPQGATVTGSDSYEFYLDLISDDRMGGTTVNRLFGTSSNEEDSPTATGVTIDGVNTNLDVIFTAAPLMAILGDPLDAMAQNLGQTDNGYVSVGGANKVLSQGFTTGPDPDGYPLTGFGVNIEGSDSKFPDSPVSVSAAVHADSGGKPGAKLFDLLSPREYAASHSFFEAPPGTTLEASTSYVLVWTHNSGTAHRLQKTSSGSEDTGARTGFAIANAFYSGPDLDNMTMDSAGDVLELAVYSRHRPNATGAPGVLASAEDPGVLAVDTSGIGDPDGIPNVGTPGSTGILHDFSYRWIRVDGDTEIVVGADSTDYRQVAGQIELVAGVVPSNSDLMIESGRYRRVEADIGKLLKVQVSFTDSLGNSETLTSLPFGPVPAPAPPLPASTLVKNTAQSNSVTATITAQYAMGFELGDHGQGYEISSVSIELAAAPSSLSVSLWMDHAPGRSGSGGATTKLFDFENPPSFAAGLNKFTAPPGAFAYQNVDYFIVLSDFGSSLSIKETTSDNEDDGNETGATLSNSAGGDTNVLRLAIEGSRRNSGILASNYAQVSDEQEIVSVGNKVGVGITVGSADRYLIRGVTFSGDNTKAGGLFTNPWDLLDGTTELFSMTNTRQINGINEWTAPQGATVAGSDSYEINQDIASVDRMGGGTGSRHFGTTSTAEDTPTAASVTLDSVTEDYAGTAPLMAVFGEPLVAMAQNLGQTDNGYRTVGSGAVKVLSQGFTTGSDPDGYPLMGFGVNIEGSDSKFPHSPTSVSVAVHADSGGKPGAKLFDLLSPGLFGAGHSFFEAPAGTTLDASTSYVLVWRYNSGTVHRLQKTASNSEDTGAFTGFAIANAFYLGLDLGNMAVDSAGDVLELAVYSRNMPATGAPIVLASAEDPGVLAVDISGIGDPDGIPNVGRLGATGTLRDFSYRWIRVDGDTETVVGADSADYRQIDPELHDSGIRIESGRYRRVEADIGKLLKVEVSFTDNLGTLETVTSLPFGPVPRPARSPSASTLVANTAQTHSATADFSGQRYVMGFELGSHGQGYDISDVSIELAAVPPSLTVSLWMGRAPGSGAAGAQTKLFDFENPSPLEVGSNRFRALPGAFAYQGVDYFIVLSDFGSSLTIKETTSDNEDTGGETGATLANSAGGDTNVLRLAIKGSQRNSGILVSTYAQDADTQEIVSIGDKGGWGITVGAANRYLIRGVSFSGDNNSLGGLFTAPWHLRDGTDELFRMVSTRQISGINEFTAPQGATVAGGCTTDAMTMIETCEEYNLYMQATDPVTGERAGGVVGSRFFGTTSTTEDSPKATGVTIGNATDDFALTTPLIAIFGEALDAMVQNLGQTDHGYRTVGSNTVKALSQGFTTGSDEFGYRLQGIGVNIEGSDSHFPDGPLSVSVAVHADSGGKPGAKLFNLVSPTGFAAGHSFFEAPPGTQLRPDTSYVMVWRHLGGTWHRMRKTASNSEDTGALTGSAIADTFSQGVDLDNLSADPDGNSLEIAVYGVKNDEEPLPPFVEGGHPVTTSWLHIPDDAEEGYQFRLVFVTHRGTLPTSGNIVDYNEFVQQEAAGTLVRGKPVRDIPAAEPYTDPDHSEGRRRLQGGGVHRFARRAIQHRDADHRDRGPDSLAGRRLAGPPHTDR
ncbi:choice-of-anchor R domain-containing protein [Candidatus Poriferisodalis sp.]|uniref:choice-of-anchor R domain-containing protein n=1 Tax=Candidatus Poriferisodalis sp. TaxID=3101277 RepID=UPI003B5169F6